MPSSRTGMSTTQPNYLLLQRDVIVVSLLALAAAAWAVIVWQAALMDTGMTSSAVGSRILLFLAMWVLMMVAMMFPTATPMVLAFHRVQAGKYQLDRAFIATWVFVATYLLVWAFAGLVAFGGVLVA